MQYQGLEFDQLPGGLEREPFETEREINHYRDVLAALVRHHCPMDAGGHTTCCCGEAWPCAEEQRAAQLLDLF